MTEYVNSVTNPAAPWSFIPDTEENILHDLERYTLDPTFEMYGDFVNCSPEWLDENRAAKYTGCTVISGNFRGYTHAFYLITDDAALIDRIAAAVQRNKARPEYQAARAKMIAELPALTLQNAAVGKHYAFCGGWFKLTGIIHLTEEEANRDALFYLDHWRGIDCHGRPTGAAFPDGRTISTTKHWQL